MKNLTIALIIGFLNQSCSVYQKTSVSLSQAYDNGEGKVVYSSGEELRFDNINFIDSVYFIDIHDRVRNEEGNFDWIEFTWEVEPSDIEAIYLKAKMMGHRIRVQFIDERETLKGYLHSVTDSSIMLVPTNNKFEVLGKGSSIEVLVVEIKNIKKSVRKAAIIGFIPGAIVGMIGGIGFGEYFGGVVPSAILGGAAGGVITGSISMAVAGKSYRIKGDVVKYRTKYMRKLKERAIYN